MRRLGTDVLALACIAGGGLVGGVATLALMADGHDTRQVMECAHVPDLEATSSVVVSVGGEALSRTIVVTPDIHRHQPHCVDVGGFQWTDFDQQQLEVARIQMEAAREKLETKRIELEGIDLRLEGAGFMMEGLGEEISQEIQEALDKEMARLERELEQLDRIGR